MASFVAGLVLYWVHPLKGSVQFRRSLLDLSWYSPHPLRDGEPRASDLVLSAEHAFLLHERPGLHLQSGASAVGGVLRGARRPGATAPISIHAPRAGYDLEHGLHHAVLVHISIHAPRAGCDDVLCRAPGAGGHFNPRTPCGVRPCATRVNFNCSIFQSTHPVRGATPQYKHTKRTDRISIHAPTWARRGQRRASGRTVFSPTMTQLRLSRAF